MRIRKKVLPVLLSLALAIGLCPTAAFGVQSAETNGSNTDSIAVPDAISNSNAPSNAGADPTTSADDSDNAVSNLDFAAPSSEPEEQREHYGDQPADKTLIGVVDDSEVSAKELSSSRPIIASGSLNPQSNKMAEPAANGETGMSRGEWLQRLVTALGMTADASNYADNYYSDIDESSSYYDTVMIATDYGILDIEAGDPVNVDDPVTREFAAHTLNYCLAFQLEDNASYTFSDSADATYPIDDQIALNRSWFSLVDGAFRPSMQASTSELSAMLLDAKSIWDADNATPDQGTNTYEFASGVVEVPETTVVTLNDDGSIVIPDCPSAVVNDSLLVVYFEGVPFGYRAQKVTWTGNTATVVTADATNDQIFASVNAGGEVEVNLEDFHEEEGATASITTMGDASKSMGLQARAIDYKNKALTVSKTFNVNGGKVSVRAVYSNLRLVWSSKNNEYSIKLVGDTAYSISGSGQADFIAPLGYINVAGFGSFKLECGVEFNGKITVAQKGKLEVGAAWNWKDGARFYRSFKKNGGPSITAQCNMTGRVSLVLDAKAPLIEAELSANMGPIVEADIKTYASGSPRTCVRISGYMHANIGAFYKFGIGGLSRSGGKTFDIWTVRNSPVKFANHYHDGKLTNGTCSRGNSLKWWSPTNSRCTGNAIYGLNGAGSSSYEDETDKPFTVFEYEVNESDEATITKYYGNVSALMIPETLDGHTVTEIAAGAFSGDNRLCSVVFPDTIKRLEGLAFSYCGSLSDVTLSKSLEYMGGYAFGECTSLASIEIPKSLTSSSYEFAGANMMYGPFAKSGLSSVTFEPGTTCVAPYLFYDCDELKRISLPETTTTLGSNAFARCDGLTAVSIPDSTTTVGVGAFASCKNLTRVDLGSGVKRLEGLAFSYCGSLSDVTLSKSLEYMGGYAFGECTSLASIEIPKSLTSSSYEFAGANMMYGPFAKSGLSSVTFEPGTTCVAPYLFYDCTHLMAITLPNTISEIGARAFYRCTSLTNLMLPASVAKLGASAFSGCTSLKTAELSTALTELPESIFESCTALQSVTFSSNLKVVGSNAFKGCVALRDIQIPSSVQTILGSAFKNCDGLSSITIPDSVTDLRSQAFYDCDGLVSVSLGTGLTKIPSQCFSHCDALAAVTVPYSVAQIEKKAFAECVALTQVTVPRGTTTIASDAFSYPAKLTIYGVPNTYAQTYAEEIGATFVAREVAATKVALSKNTLTLNRRDQLQLTVAVEPIGFTDAVIWKSTNESVATVTESGLVQAVAPGTATIKVTVGDQDAVCDVTVQQSVDSVRISESDFSIGAFETKQLHVSIYPSDAPNKTLRWASSNTAVATVDALGLVRPAGKGTAVISCTSESNPQASDSVAVTVSSNIANSSTLANIQSLHPYSSNTDTYWTYSVPNAKAIAISFDSRTNLEEGFDYLCLYDGSGKEMGRYTGTSLAGKTVTIDGSSLRIRLISDSSGEAWGFRATSIKAANPSQEGWVQSGSKWRYRNSDGTYTANCWKQINGIWYHFDKDGWRQTGWAKVGSSWYYLGSSGAMATGWQKVGSSWYFLGSSGAMQTGWLKTGGSWYYLGASGAMATGWAKVGSSWYYLGSSGAMRTGWLQLAGKWYYLDGSGAMATGWRQVGAKWYHFNGSGAMSQNCWVGSYYLTDSGAMATNTWIGKYHVNASGVWDKTR